MLSLAFDWLRSWREFSRLITERSAKPKQSCITFDTQLNLSLKHTIGYRFLFGLQWAGSTTESYDPSCWPNGSRSRCWERDWHIYETELSLRVVDSHCKGWPGKFQTYDAILNKSVQCLWLVNTITNQIRHLELKRHIIRMEFMGLNLVSKQQNSLHDNKMCTSFSVR